MAFLPGLCRHIMGDDLHIPSVATWWCGQEGPRQQVLDDLKQVVIKPAFRRFGLRTEFPALMTDAAREALAARIRAQPDQYVAQEQVDLSTAPTHTHRGMEARHVVMRVMAAWDGHSYAVLPGGLTRVSTEPQSLVVSMQLGGGSKDTWVLGGAEPATAAVRPPARRPDRAGMSAELSSRAADTLFWLGRYAERLETNVRLVRALLPGESDRGRAASVDIAAHFLRGLQLLPREFHHAHLAQQWWSLQRVLGQIGVRFGPSVRHRLEPQADPPSQLGGEGPPVTRYVASAAATRA